MVQWSDNECCKKVSNLQSLVKMKATNIWSESSKTGSGPPPKPLSNQEETMLATLLLESVYCIDGGMDTSESQETMTEEVCPEMNESEAVEEGTAKAAVTLKIPSAANKPSLKHKLNNTNEIKEAMSLKGGKSNCSPKYMTCSDVL